MRSVNGSTMLTDTFKTRRPASRQGLGRRATRDGGGGNDRGRWPLQRRAGRVRRPHKITGRGGRHCGDHELHQHLQSRRHDRGRAAGPQCAQKGPRPASPGSRPRWRRAPRWSPSTSVQGRADRRTSRRSASISSATAARPASATRARCRSRSPRRSSEHDLVACSVLSGNRNFEGRIHADIKANYLASPPLVVAYAIRRDGRHRPDA